MYSSVVILSTATLLVLGVTCHLFPQADSGKVANIGTSKVSKRQNADLNQCAFNRFNAFYQGNASHLVANCRSIFTSGFNLATANQSTINFVYRTLCLPDCGNVFLDAYAACGDDSQRSTLASLCSSNRNGNLCYELHVENLALISNARSCSGSGQCNCLQLSEGVTRQGCCINILHDIYKSRGIFGPLEVAYGDCSIALPETRCNNGPLRGSSHLPQASLCVVLLSIVFVITTM